MAARKRPRRVFRDSRGRFISKPKKKTKKKLPKKKPKKKSKSQKPPRGLKPLKPKPKRPVSKRKPSKKLIETAREWRDYFREVLSDACEQLSEYPCHWSTVQNKDGSVDGELRIEPLPEDKTIFEVLEDIQMGGAWRKGDYWISVVLLIDGKKAAELGYIYPYRDRGVAAIDTHAQPGRDAGAVFFHAQEIARSILETMGEIFVGVLVRIHWNHADRQPPRSN